MNDEPTTPMEIATYAQREHFITLRKAGFTRLEALLLIAAQITIGMKMNEIDTRDDE